MSWPNNKVITLYEQFQKICQLEERGSIMFEHLKEQDERLQILKDQLAILLGSRTPSPSRTPEMEISPPTTPTMNRANALPVVRSFVPADSATIPRTNLWQEPQPSDTTSASGPVLDAWVASADSMISEMLLPQRNNAEIDLTSSRSSVNTP